MPHFSTLSAKQRLAGQLLAAGTTRKETSQQLSIDPSTLSKWRLTAEFQEYLNHLLAQHETEAMQSLYAHKIKAIERLGMLMYSKNHGAALKAIDIILTRTEASISVAQSATASDAAWRAMQLQLTRLAKEANHAG